MGPYFMPLTRFKVNLNSLLLNLIYTWVPNSAP